jgi:hypothetical protein
LIDRQRLR